MRFVSWNVNGLRACMRKGCAAFFARQRPDVVALQEIKVSDQDVPALKGEFERRGYETFWNPARKNGYSGTAVFSKQHPRAVTYGIGDPAFDDEGRVIACEFLKFIFVNAYFPHTQRTLARLDFKLAFDRKFQAFCRKTGARKPLVMTGDWNVAHTPDDLANPKQNERNAGFTKEERQWFDAFLRRGYADTFRMFTAGKGHYTWWTYRANARSRNIGWRIDYFLVSNSLRSKVRKSQMLPGVFGSDHCPVALEIAL